MPIAPETKDWTWVLTRPCDECGFDASTFPATGVAQAIRDQAPVWRKVLEAPDVATRAREDRWSALEYACHVRDVFRLYDERLRRMLAEDDPAYPNWDQDAAAVENRYAEQDPATVADEIAVAAAALADRFDTVTGEQWQRTGTRSDGAQFTVEKFSRYLLHDPVHHLHDVGAG